MRLVPNRTPTISPYLYWIAAASLLLPVWAGRYFPTEDGPAHVYYTEVYRDLGHPRSVFQPYYERSVSWNTPNLTYFGLQYALAAVMKPDVAQKVAVSLIVLGTVAAGTILAVSATGGIGLGALVALLLVHNYFLYSGYFSFLAGLPFLLLTLALLVGPLDDVHLPDRRLTRILLSLLLLGVASFYSHLVVGGAFLLLVGLRSVCWPGASIQRRGLLLAAAVPVGLLILTYMLGPSTGGGGLRWLSTKDAIRSLGGLWFWQGFAVPGLGFALRRTGFIVVIGLLVWPTGRALVGGALSPARQFVLLAAGCLLVLRFVMPDFIGKGGLLVGRMDLMLMTLVLPALSPPLPGKAQRPLTALVLILLAWQLLDTTLRIRRFSGQYVAVAAQVGSIPPGTVIHVGPDYEESGNRFEGSYARVFSEIAQQIGYQCRCIVVGEHHPSVPYYWVRERAGASAHVRLLVRIEATHSGPEGGQGLSLRVTEVSPQRP
jgi:hypothetical protein